MYHFPEVGLSENDGKHYRNFISRGTECDNSLNRYLALILLPLLVRLKFLVKPQREEQEVSLRGVIEAKST